MRIRRSKRIWAVALGVFVAVFLFTFLTAKFKDNEEADAANLGAFDAGYIISDYQMSNYNAMNEAEIQSFLTAKNPCANSNYSYYLQLSANKNYTWHWANGHFVCLSEERFGDGETIGSGDTAAHIIWQAAQDYRINPQVLLVLLQKETGLITDPIPNNGDYRKATGYGCPDTAACSSKYYGFKNQVRNAAALFRTVLDGGWTNYPLGNNYVQYNPNAGCGGSVVNIRSLATSALYRYTPYQPNAAALNAGYGYGDGCSAYGNRNFYSYFEDWFGGIKETNENYVGINKIYSENGGEKGILGKARTGVLTNPVSGIAWVEYEKGFIVGDKTHGYYISMGKIRDVWASFNFECGKLGFPLSGIESNDSTGIVYQKYENGYIVGNDKYGYYISMGKIRDVWAQQGYEYGSLGFPKSNVLSNSSSGIEWQEFENGFIVGNKSHGYYISMGKIRSVWAKQGYEFGSLGFPKSNVITDNNGLQYQMYDNNLIIVGSDEYGCYYVPKGVYDTWKKIGLDKSGLGKPKSNVLSNSSSGIEWQEFENGFIVGNKSHGYYISMGKIRSVWAKQGYEFGSLGFPKSNVITDNNGLQYQMYDGGMIYYSNDNGVWIEWL